MFKYLFSSQRMKIRNVIFTLLFTFLFVKSTPAQVLQTGSITTAGADCTVTTNCITLNNLRAVDSVSINVIVGTTGTFQFEFTTNGTTYTAMPDDVNSATSTTANGSFFFSNPGYRSIRVRASAISGAATITMVQGYAHLRSTATLTGGGGDGAILDGVSAAIKATVLDLTNSNPLTTALVDASGNQITSFGGGTQYTTGAATAGSPIGTLPIFDNAGTIAKVSDTAGLPVKTLTGSTTVVTGTVGVTESGTWTVQPGNTANTTAWKVDGSAVTQPISGTVALGAGSAVVGHVIADTGSTTAVTALPALPAGSNVIGHVIADTGSTTAVTGNVTVVQATGTNLHTVCDSGCSSSTAPADNSAFTAGTTSTSPMAGFYHSTVDTVTDNRIATVGMTNKRGLFVNPQDSVGAALLGTAAAGADNVSNPTLGGLFAYTMCWDSGGSNWDRCGAAGAASTVAGNKTNNNAAPGATNVGVLGGIANAVAPSWTEGNLVNHSVDLHGSTRVLWMDSSGNVVTPEVSATTNTTTQPTGPQLFGNGSTAAPSAVGADGRSVAVWTDLNGRVRVTGDASMSKLLVTPDSIALPANQSVNVSQVNGVTALMGNGVTGTGSQRVTIASDNTAFTVNAAESGTWTVQPGNTANTTAWIVQPVAGTTNGASTCVLQSAASTNSTNCKASAGLLYGIEVVNTTSTLYYLRLYNASSAPTCSSATGFIRTVPIPHNTGAGAGLANFYTVGETYGTGISFCLTGGGSSTDNTNAATGVYLTLHYK